MKVKDLIIKLDNAGIEIKFLEDNPLKVVNIANIDTLKKVYNSGNKGEIFDRNIRKWEINGHGETISILLK